MGEIIKSTKTAAEEKVEVAVTAAAVTHDPEHVEMLLLNKDSGSVQRLWVHKKTVAAHQEQGWVVVKE